MGPNLIGDRHDRCGLEVALECDFEKDKAPLKLRERARVVIRFGKLAQEGHTDITRMGRVSERTPQNESTSNDGAPKEHEHPCRRALRQADEQTPDNGCRIWNQRGGILGSLQ